MNLHRTQPNTGSSAAPGVEASRPRTPRPQSRRTVRSRNTRRAVLLSVTLVAVVGAFRSADTIFADALPQLLAAHGFRHGASLIWTSLITGLIAGIAHLLASTIERARHHRYPAWTPYGIRGTANARRCRSRSWSVDATRTAPSTIDARPHPEER